MIYRGNKYFPDCFLVLLYGSKHIPGTTNTVKKFMIGKPCALRETIDAVFFF